MKEEIEDLIQQAIGDNDELFLVDLKLTGHKGGSQKLTILIDGDRGISVDECSRISRSIGNLMDEKNIITGNYTLEVSSPGIDTPLQSERQYKKNIGRRLKVLTKDGQEVKGELLNISDKFIVMNSEKKIKKKIEKEELEIPLENVKKAKVLVSF